MFGFGRRKETAQERGIRRAEQNRAAIEAAARERVRRFQTAAQLGDEADARGRSGRYQFDAPIRPDRRED